MRGGQIGVHRQVEVGRDAGSQRVDRPSDNRLRYAVVYCDSIFNDGETVHLDG